MSSALLTQYCINKLYCTADHETLIDKIRYLIVCSVQCASLSYIKDGGDIYQDKLSSLLSEGNQKLWAEYGVYTVQYNVLFT